MDRKGTESFLLSVLRSFYRQRMSMALSRTHATSISRWVVTTSEGSSRLGVLSDLAPLSLVDMLQAIDGGFGGGFNTQWFPCLLVAHLFWAVCLPGLWSRPLVLFLSLSWVLSLHEVWQGFIIFTKYINQVTRVNQQHRHWYLQCIGGGDSSFCEQLSIGAIMLLLCKASVWRTLCS